MKEILQLTKFLIFSFYKKPKQQMLQIVLLIALVYGFLQVTALNFFVYFISTTQILMFYNLVISAILVFVLTCYLSTTQVFAFTEFKLLAPLPLRFKKISIAKVISGIVTPVGLTLIVQIPTILFLLIDAKFMEALKLFIFLPVFTGIIYLALLFILSIINRFYYRFKSKVAYLLTNVFIMTIIPVAFLVYFVKKSVFIIEVTFDSFQDIIHMSRNLLTNMYDAVDLIPVVNATVEYVVLGGTTTSFVLTYIAITIGGFLLLYFIIQNISTNYFANGILDNEQTSDKSTKVHISQNKWINYVQREFWVLNSESYFKMQLIVGVLLAPIISVFYFLFVQFDWLPTYVNITENKNFIMYFAYLALFLSSMNNISGTPYSREGKYHYLLKSTPLNEKYIYFTKVIIASAMSILSILLSFVLLLSFGYWEPDVLVMLPVLFILVICYNMLTPIYDKNNPVVEWDAPSIAIKSNPNVLVSLLYGMPILIVTCAIHFALVWINLPLYLIYSTILLGVIITMILLIKRINKNEKAAV